MADQYSDIVATFSRVTVHDAEDITAAFANQTDRLRAHWHGFKNTLSLGALGTGTMAASSIGAALTLAKGGTSGLAVSGLLLGGVALAAAFENAVKIWNQVDDEVEKHLKTSGPSQGQPAGIRMS